MPIAPPLDAVLAGDCLALLRKLPANYFRLAVTSPPYALKTRRYEGAREKLTWAEWTAWMALVVYELCRVTRGFVIVVANNPVKGGEELPANELLRVELFGMGVKFEKTVIWHKNPPGGKRPWFINAWEPCMAFYLPPRPTIWEWERIASAPKYTTGGRYRQRNATGARRLGNEYPDNPLARPRDVLYVPVGGGHMGSDLAHENEAPYPEGIVEPFVLSLSSPGDIVLDPFCGGGTTLAVAKRLGRRYVGIDVRPSQVELSLRRLATVEPSFSSSPRERL